MVLLGDAPSSACGGEENRLFFFFTGVLQISSRDGCRKSWEEDLRLVARSGDVSLDASRSRTGGSGSGAAGASPPVPSEHFDFKLDCG